MTYLDENENFDFSAEIIQNLIQSIEEKAGGISNKSYAIAAYNYIRDNWAYYPYRFSLKLEDWKASNIAPRSKGHCLDKAVLLISVLRGRGIPARLGLAKVVNHIAVEGMLKKLGSEVLVPHGYVDIFLDNRWVKATPAFNVEICKKLGVDPLPFDGEQNSLFQEYNTTGSVKFMEYLEDYGTFDAVPLEFLRDLIKKTYPVLQNVNLQIGQEYNFGNLG